MNIRPLLFWLTLLLSGCSSSTLAHFSWSDLSPTRWFGNSLQLSDKGIGDITADTIMTESAINDGLKGNYHLRRGMATDNGQPIVLYQGVEDGQIKLEIFGQPQGNVMRIDVMDENITTPWGVKLGTPFSQLYQKAFAACVRVAVANSNMVECVAPGSKHVSYQFIGTWHGPEGLMPSDDVLQNWTVSKIIWRVKIN